MCGLAGLFGSGFDRARLEAMGARLRHRGPDAAGLYVDPAGGAGLAHRRLSIIDLSEAGTQPFPDPTGRYWLAYNGEVYNYLELRERLTDYPFRTGTDTEVILAAWLRWGEECLERFVGMFAFLVWDREARRLFAARDRFGVKPLYHAAEGGGGLAVASEIKALLTPDGSPREPDDTAWATYLGRGVYDHGERTFWRGVRSLPAGHVLTWQDGRTRTRPWYELARRVPTEPDPRPAEEVREEYAALLADSVRLRFRSDVPVGINLSGGLDSSLLLGLVDATQTETDGIRVFTFVTGDPRYDELPWVRQMLERTDHPLTTCALTPEDVPALAESVQDAEDEPFGGLPTLAYARLFEEARRRGVIVLLDGQGMDEQWAGYDYYLDADRAPATTVQGTRERPVRPGCLRPAFLDLAEPFVAPIPFGDPLRDLQYRDIRYTKIPRALRFNDRISMRTSTELREPFLDHRLVELALRQRAELKIAGGQRKWLLRRIAADLMPAGVVEAPKRPLQTPQREWLRGPLRPWVEARIEAALDAGREWLDTAAVRREWRRFQEGRSDNSFYVWQWIGLGLLLGHRADGARRDAGSRPVAAVAGRGAGA